jgi:hypothetical protein
MMVLGLAVFAWFFVEPHADFTVQTMPARDGDYTLVAAPGPSYSFRWFPDSAKEPQSQAFGTTDQMKVHIADGATQTVKLEVKNAFGRIGSKLFTITRPAPPADKTAPPTQGGAAPQGGK